MDPLGKNPCPTRGRLVWRSPATSAIRSGGQISSTARRFQSFAAHELMSSIHQQGVSDPILGWTAAVVLALAFAAAAPDGGRAKEAGRVDPAPIIAIVMAMPAWVLCPRAGHKQQQILGLPAARCGCGSTGAAPPMLGLDLLLISHRSPFSARADEPPAGGACRAS